ncbi:MAG: hypothetical protein E7104_12230 [Prevotella sp.]|nr:hypothetical protein [Prevotella sp.]
MRNDKLKKNKENPQSIMMPLASMQEKAFVLMKTSIQSPCLFSALSQAIVTCFEKNLKNLIQSLDATISISLGFFGARHRGFYLKRFEP